MRWSTVRFRTFVLCWSRFGVNFLLWLWDISKPLTTLDRDFSLSCFRNLFVLQQIKNSVCVCVCESQILTLTQSNPRTNWYSKVESASLKNSVQKSSQQWELRTLLSILSVIYRWNLFLEKEKKNIYIMGAWMINCIVFIIYLFLLLFHLYIGSV